MCRDIGDPASGGLSLVVARGVEHQLAQRLAVGVDDADLAVGERDLPRRSCGVRRLTPLRLTNSWLPGEQVA